MKYYTWKLKWINNEGHSFSELVNNDEVRVEPLFVKREINFEDDIYYGVCKKGIIDINLLTDWNIVEITYQDMLDARNLIFPIPIDDKIYIWNEDLISWVESSEQ